MDNEIISGLEQGRLLRIYLDENDKIDGQPAYHWIVARTMEAGLKGATVLRGMEGFGSRQQLHTSHMVSLSSNLPVVIEVIDSEDQIGKLVSILQNKLNDGMISVERVRYRHLGS